MLLGGRRPKQRKRTRYQKLVEEGENNGRGRGIRNWWKKAKTTGEDEVSEIGFGACGRQGAPYCDFSKILKTRESEAQNEVYTYHHTQYTKPAVEISVSYIAWQTGNMDAESLLQPAAPLLGAVDYRGAAAVGRVTGGWTAALFIIGVEVAERFAYYGISLNLITYLTDSLHDSTASAAAAVNAWVGVSSMLPLLGAFIADSYLGRFRMIVASSLLYVLGLCLLTMSTVLPIFRPPKCNNAIDPTSCQPSQFQIAFFYISIYLVAFAQGGHKPCVQAFGADQFNENDPEEVLSRSSFFNWWYFGMCGGVVVTLLVLTYVQDNIGWGLGFGIPAIAMAIALLLFLLGTKTYRFQLLEDKSPFINIAKTFITIARNRSASHVNHRITSSEQEGILDNFHGKMPINEDGGYEAEEAMGVLRLIPIWCTCLIYGVFFAQSSTFFTKQGSTLDRRIGSRIQFPPAALQSFIAGTIFVLIPIYDRVFVPLARRFSKAPSGITMLQRIGIGIFFSVITMVVAALVETKRLKVAREYGLVDQPTAVLPMSLWWLVPQYILFGISDMFAIVGFQEFFYDQMPDALKSLGLALYLSIIGIGSFISSFLVFVINKATTSSGESWFSNNLNHGHLDYFYWVLTGVSGVGFIMYIYFAQAYIYKKK